MDKVGLQTDRRLCKWLSFDSLSRDDSVAMPPHCIRQEQPGDSTFSWAMPRLRADFTEGAGTHRGSAEAESGN
jgi:hypothetical protein